MKIFRNALCYLGLCFVIVQLQAQTPELIPYRYGELWGYCTPDKKIVIKPQYERATWFYKGIAKVAKGCKNDCYDVYDGEWFFIDQKGNSVEPTNVDTVKILNYRPKSYALERYKFNKENVNELGYSTNKKGKKIEYWDDPEMVFFLRLDAKYFEHAEDWPEKPVLSFYYPLKHLMGKELAPYLVLLRNDATGITPEKIFALEKYPENDPEIVSFYISDYNSLKPFISKTDPNSTDYKLMFSCSIQVPTDSMQQNTLFNLMRFDIQFLDINGYGMLYYHTSMYELSKEFTKAYIIGKMLKDLHETARVLKAQGDNQNVKIEGNTNPYKGKMLFDVMEQANEDDVWQFLRYVEFRPFIYMGGKWKFSEVFATWVAEGAPKVVKK